MQLLLQYHVHFKCPWYWQSKNQFWNHCFTTNSIHTIHLIPSVTYMFCFTYYLYYTCFTRKLCFSVRSSPNPYLTPPELTIPPLPFQSIRDVAIERRRSVQLLGLQRDTGRSRAHTGSRRFAGAAAGGIPALPHEQSISTEQQVPAGLGSGRRHLLHLHRRADGFLRCTWFLQSKWRLLLFFVNILAFFFGCLL